MIKEDFLHYIWRFKLLDFNNLKTTDNNVLEIQNFGDYTQLQGPDFFNAKIKIDNQVWAGNIEMHVKSSDWYLHHHELDKNYSNVILHVVWEYDVEVFSPNNQKIPVLVLRDYVPLNVINSYLNFFKMPNIINCENQINNVPQHVITNWKERLFFERLELKIEPIEGYKNVTKSNWEYITFIALSKAFGLNTNGEIFKQMALNIPYEVFQKVRLDIITLESLFFGTLNLLPSNPSTIYEKKLCKEFEYIQHKYNIQPLNYTPEFYKHRPDNFPTIRIAQLAQILNRTPSLFDAFLNAKSITNYLEIFNINTSDFWKTHYTFNSASILKSKKITKNFVHLLLINCIIPLLYVYYKSISVDKLEELINFIEYLPKEINNATKIFNKLQFPINNAFDSQVVLQLKNTYCDLNKCLHCSIGNYILNKKA